MSLIPTPFEALMQAVEMAGSQTNFAALCGVSQAAVWKWLQTSKLLPAEHVLSVEAATGVPRHLLRPDLYPLELPASSVRWHGVGARFRAVSDQTSALLSRGAA